MTSLVIFLWHLEEHLLSISDKAGWPLPQGCSARSVWAALLHALCVNQAGQFPSWGWPWWLLDRLAEWWSFPFLELEGGILTKKLGEGLQHPQTELWWGRPLPAHHSLSPWNPCSPGLFFVRVVLLFRVCGPPDLFQLVWQAEAWPCVVHPCCPGGASSGEPRPRILLSSPSEEHETFQCLETVKL